MKKEELTETIIRSRVNGESYIKISREIGIHPDKIKYMAEKIGVNGAFVRELRLSRLSVLGELEKGSW